ncbi:MAG TPA: hypothetical protein VJU78_18625 [Chitinophagaceae bacterium]|nr:hypothetical protein [Chitinophagaceae bacterium]
MREAIDGQLNRFVSILAKNCHAWPSILPYAINLSQTIGDDFFSRQKGEAEKNDYLNILNKEIQRTTK